MKQVVQWKEVLLLDKAKAESDRSEQLHSLKRSKTCPSVASVHGCAYYPSTMRTHCTKQTIGIVVKWLFLEQYEDNEHKCEQTTEIKFCFALGAQWI